VIDEEITSLFNRPPGGGARETLETLDACIYPVTTCILVALLNFDLEKDESIHGDLYVVQFKRYTRQLALQKVHLDRLDNSVAII
jgi:hypothetical protein